MSGKCLIIAIFGALSASPASAGVYTDEFAKCLVEATTTEDRTALVKWMFTAASSHPAIRSMSTVTQADMNAANQTMGALLMRLMTESCRDTAKKALKYEGAVTIPMSFQVLGQVAGQEMFSNPAVATGMSGIDKFIDPAKLQALKDESTD